MRNCWPSWNLATIPLTLNCEELRLWSFPARRAQPAEEPMSIRTRLQRLEQVAPKATCPACRDRSGRSVLVITHRLADGSWLSQTTDMMPEPCFACGEIPESIIEITEVLLQSREQVEKWARECT